MSAARKKKVSRRGGARPGAGRPRIPDAERTFVAHRTRPDHNGKSPVLVTLRVQADVPSLRQPKLTRLVEEGLVAHRAQLAAEESTFRVLRLTIERDRILLVVEADDELTLTRGTSGLMVRLARRINPAVGRSGRFWAERYNARPLVDPKEARATLRTLERR